MEPQVKAWQKYQQTLGEIQETREMLELPEMAELAREELPRLEHAKGEMEQELRLLLLPRDPDADKNVVVEIRQGAGGDEAALFGALLLRMYTRYAERNRFKVEMVSGNMTELGGVKEAIITITGTGAFSRLKYESGVHRVQRVPATESGGRIHTSTCTVAVLPEAEDVEVELSPGDLRIDTYRAGGAGGQHVNRTDSAVRMTHIPTGIVAQCQNERSQIQNREVCLRILKSRLLELREREKEAQMADIKGEMKKIEWGSQIRSYVFQPYTMVKDHRTNYESGNVDDVMDGNLDGFITAFLKMQ